MAGHNTIRLIHTSDTHLGDDWRSDLAETAFARVIESVSFFEVDALLVVGDVFDHARVPDRVLEFYLDQIARIDCPVVTLPGNHDLYHEESLYLREPFQNVPPNFHLLTGREGQTISFPELGLDVWGRAMTQHNPEFRPLENMPAGGDGRWLVALAHGHFHFPEDTDLRSSPIQEGEVREAPCHYLALGHWERHCEVSRGDTSAFYSGSPLGSSPRAGHIGVNLVELDRIAGVTVTQAIVPLEGPLSRAPDAAAVVAGREEI